MKIDEALYQLKQNIKMHEIEGTTSNQNEREKALLDYITNLQKQLHQASLDIQELTEKDIECPSWCDKLTNLQEELESANESITWWNNRFNAKNNGFKSTVEELCETTKKLEKLQEKYEKMKENAEILSKGYSDLEKRNEKAIKLLKEAGCYDEETKTFCDDVWEELPKLLNILNGGDDNE